MSLRLAGYRDFARQLRRLDLADSLKAAHHTVATSVVAAAERRGLQLGGVHAHVVKTGAIRATKEASKASVRLGGASAKYGPAFGAEFGSERFPQFPAWRGNQNDAGYMIHPAIRDLTASGELLDLWGDALDRELKPPRLPD
ncbi:MAG: hypothetical protein R2695_04140 [Acidimicrobiales bacterium]